MLPGLIGLTGFSSSTVSADAAIAALGLTAWWDPSDLSTVFTDAAGTTPAAVGNAVARINDKSGNGNHLINSTGANRPTLGQSGSLYYLVFSNVGTFLDCAGLTMTQDNDFCLGAMLSGTTFRFVFDGLTPTARQAFIYQSNITKLYAGTGTVNDGTYTANTPYVFTARFNGASSFVRRDGVSTTAASTPGSQGITGIRVGAAGADGSSPWPGNLYGMVCRDTVFSAGELTTIEAYMAGKSGVTL